MDAADVSQRVPSDKKPRVDDETLQHWAAVTKVLEDDNLLREIIVRVGFPTTLVRAALVCKQWLGHASDPSFLCHFRKLHPPRLLGYYMNEKLVSSDMPDPPRFVPMLPQPPELAAVIRRVAGYRLGAHEIMHCRNGKIFSRLHEKWGLAPSRVHHPLCSDRDMPIVPPIPHVQVRSLQKFSSILSKEEEGRSSYVYVLGQFTKEAGKTMTRVYMLQDGVWCMHTSVTCQLPHMGLNPEGVFVGNKIYMLTAFDDNIIVLDLTASNFSTIQLPHGVKNDDCMAILSRGDDASGVYLIDFKEPINVKEPQLCVWLYKGDNWILVDTICLHEMRAILGMSYHMLVDENIFVEVEISQVGDNGQLLFLRIGQCIFYLDIKCRALCKVYENTVNGRLIGDIHPLMMIWPPTFPALKDDPTRNSM